MTMRATGLRDDLFDYLVENFSGEDEFLKNLLIEAKDFGIPQISISAEQVKFIQFILKAINARNVLEIGTLAGYSAIAIARALPDDGKITTIELEQKHFEFASKKIQEAGLSHKITIINENALTFLEHYSPDEKLDFVFLDADKNNYYKYVKILDKYVKNGGIISADNAFAFGFVTQSAPERNPDDIKSIKSFNEYMKNNYFTTIAPVGDGLLLSLKI
jgi:predicted O-methyltransferase YrrM